MKKKNLLMTAIAIFGLATITFGQTVPSYVPTNGLVGWWPFNGNANDESGNGNNGVVTAALLTSDRDNIINSAYNFDFTGKTFGNLNKEIYFPYSPNYNVSNLTVSVWVYPRAYYWTGDINNPNSVIIRRFQYGYSNPNGQVWGIDFNANSLSGFILAPSSQNNQTSASVISNTPLTLNQWHHIVMSYNRAVLTLYLNGNVVSSTNTTLTLNAAGNSGISVGVSNQANGYWNDADAIIDDIGIWNRALTQQEITDLYTSSTLGISEVSQSNLFLVYPNPANSQINLKADSKLLGYVYNVYDNIGQMVLSGKINSENTVIDLGNLSGGVYLFSIGENFKESIKIIKSE